MRRRLTKRENVLLGLLCLTAALPFATVLRDSKPLNDAPLASVVPVITVTENREEFRKRVRMIDAVQEKCGEEDVCPDMSDERGMGLFLQGLPWRHAAAPAEAVAGTGSMVPSFADLSRGERAIIRQYAKSGRCPVLLESILPGLQALCNELRTPATNLYDLTNILRGTR